MHTVTLKSLPKSGEYETETRNTYVAKQRAEAAREGKDKPFGGAAADKTHNHLRKRGNTYLAVPAPLSNQMLDYIEGYLDNIATAATQAVAKGGPLAELSAILAISVDTVSALQK